MRIKLEDHTLVKLRWDIRVHGWRVKTNDPIKEEARLKDICDYEVEHKEEYAIAVKPDLNQSYFNTIGTDENIEHFASFVRGDAPIRQVVLWFSSEERIKEAKTEPMSVCSEYEARQLGA